MAVERGTKFGERTGRRASDGEVAGKPTDRIAREERIDAEMDDLAFGLRSFEARDPWHIAFEHEDRVGTVEKRAGIVAEMAGMIGRKAKMARTMLDDRNCEALRKIGERFDRSRIAPGAGGDDQRVLSRRKDASSFIACALVDTRRGSSASARRGI